MRFSVFTGSLCAAFAPIGANKILTDPNTSSAGQRIHRVQDDDHAIVAVGLLEAVGIEDARRLWRFFDEELMFESEGRVANRDDVVVAERLDDPLGDGYTVDLGAVRAFVDNRIVWAFGIQLGMVAG